MRTWMLGGVALLGLLACDAEVRDFTPGGAGGDPGPVGVSSVSSGPGGGAPPVTGEGPQLVRSVPADGDDQASISPHFLLYFDRPVNFALATGKVRVATDAVAETFVLTGPCPDNDPTCVACAYSEAFQTERRLPGGTKHTITIDKSLPDADGKTNDVDKVISYTTFAYDLRLFDDSAVIQDEPGGLDYDPVTQSLFACGLGADRDGFLIRKIQLQNGVPQRAVTAATVSTSNTGGPYCYALDVHGDRLFAAGTYASRMFIFRELQGDVLRQVAVLNGTGLDTPNDTLVQVTSTALLDNKAYFGGGGFLGGPTLSGIVACELSSLTCSLWLDATNVFPYDRGFMVGQSVIDGVPYLFVAVSDNGELLKIDARTRQIVNRHKLESLYSAQLRSDSKGRLYVASGQGIVVFDTSGTDGFREIASRRGLEAGRLGLREEGDTVHVYFMPFRGKATIGTTAIRFN